MKENSSQQLHMLRYTLTEQLIHGMEVSNLAYDLARELGYEKEICYELAKAGVLHDIGKIVLENYVEEQDTLVVEEMRSLKSEYGVEVRRQALPYSEIRWIMNDPSTYDIAKLNLTSDTLRVEDMRGGKLLLFTSPWNVDWATDHNPDLILSEFGNVAF